MSSWLDHHGSRDALERLLEEAAIDAPAGRVADYIPELRRAPLDDAAIALADLDGGIVSAGHADKPFTIQSVSKIIALLYALEQIGPKLVFSRVGKEPSGDPFNSGLRLQTGSKRPHNPMINAGAIVVSSLFPGNDPADAFQRFLDFTRLVCKNPDLAVDEDVYQSEKATGHNNRSLAWLMNDRKVFTAKRGQAPVDFVEGILDVYFRQCAISVTAIDLARLGALLANLGREPGTGTVIVSAAHVAQVLALMGSCGLYDGSGRFAARTGIPCKSGVAGGMVGAVPGRLGLATYAPGLDATGNSALGVFLFERIARDNQLSVISRPRELFRLKKYKDDASLDALVARTRVEATSGQVATYIPELAHALPEHRAISLCLLDGTILAGGQHDDYRFTLQATCIPVLLACLIHRRGSDFVMSKVGMEPTGDRFDANTKWLTIDGKACPFNPMNSAGAILLSSMLPEATSRERRQGFLRFVRELCGNPHVEVNERVFESELATGEKNRQLAWELMHAGSFAHRRRPEGQTKVDYVEEIVSDYFWACSLEVCTDDVARIAAFFASQGSLPEVTPLRMASEHVSIISTLMSTCGLYEGSGEWALSVGVPSKSGISGVIMSTVPGRLGIATYCSAVDDKGTSVAGRFMMQELAHAERLNIYDDDLPRTSTGHPSAGPIPPRRQ